MAGGDNIEGPGTTRRWRIDCESLKKGDDIPRQTIERILNTSAGTKKYDLGKLKLAAGIEKIRAAMGMPIVIKHDCESLHICTDAEASEVTHWRQVSNARRILRDFHRANTAIDVTQLQQDELERHMRWQEIDGKRVQGILGRPARIVPAPTVRTVPGLMGMAAARDELA